MNDLQFMPHQEEVLNLTDDKNRCAYYLEMGLGKTFVGAEKMYLLNNNVNLIVCQKSKIEDWVDHIRTFYPEYWVMDLTNKNDSSVFRKIMESKGIYEFTSQIVGVINYDLIFRRPYIAHITDFTLMLDESSLICNENAKRSKFILKLHPESVILLSGTPTAGKYERLPSGEIDPDYNPYIKYQLVEQSSVEYLIRVGVEGLKRIIENNEFTKSEKVAEQIDEYENENNPIKAFIDECGVEMIEDEQTGDVYSRYQVFCADCGMQPMSNIVFSKQINKRLGFETVVTKVGGKSIRIFRKV